MRLTSRLFVGSMLVGLLLGCDANTTPRPTADDDDGKSAKRTAKPQPKAAPAPAKKPASPTAPTAPIAPPNRLAPAPSLAGVVLETMDAKGYTYVRIKTQTGDQWAAAPKTVVAVGDTVELYGALPMHDFSSPTLDRTFKYILFASRAVVVGKPGSSPAKPSTPQGTRRRRPHRSRSSRVTSRSSPAVIRWPSCSRARRIWSASG